ncbi:glucan endo-1,3-beta-glucosidase 2-like [Durio zibethinus]|uniref:glucan endo-1,3-beta-D-glucosidase n=1 Tax=Durio zibethinus TaxID=66656 RepID=A0A6P5YSX5_DURZI|nr:glucan endo-1,3-beta-glucosidase 2-like [Durio zibethinus]
MMAKGASSCLFLSLLFLLIICSSGTLVGFSYHARGEPAACSTSRTISFLQLNKVSPSQIRVFVADHTALSTLSNSGVSVDLHLNESLVENLRSSNSTAISWLKTHLITVLPHVDIKTIVVTRITNDFRGQTELVKLLSTLKSIHSLLSSFDLHKEVKVSVAFSSSFLQKMKSERDLHKIFGFIKKTGSSVILEAIMDGELISMGDRFVQSVIEEASLATSSLPCTNVPIILTMKSSAVPSSAEVAEFTAKVEKSLENNVEITSRIAALYAEVSSVEDFVEKELEEEEEQISLSSRRELLSSVKKTAHDTIIPPTTTFPTPPTSTTPVSFPPNNPTPIIVTVPSTNPVTVTPTNPAETPSPIPITTPVTVPSTIPNNPTVPITNPVTTPTPITEPGAQPVTNPVTTYPAPTGGVPVSTPVTNPVQPPATTNAPAIPGQSWCVARTGALETSLQAALDYACGIGGADCSQIQQGANCFNPNTLQNHASYAFNSYYQKNPAPTSCDFGGTATTVNTNPSSGSCIYPSSASQSTPTATPATTSPTSGAGVTGSVTPTSVLNSSNPGSASTTVFGSDTPPSVNTSTSLSAGLQPFISCSILLTSFVAGVIFLDA